MRHAAASFAVLSLLTMATAADVATVKPLTPAEAAKKIDEKVTVEFEVKSTGGKDNVYLNSEADFKDAKNFTVYLPKEAVGKFKEAKIADPREHFKGKTVRVTGTMALYKDKPQIKVDEPGQVKLVDVKK